MVTKRKNCNPKKSYNCGNSCITTRYVCRKDGLQGQSVEITNRLTDAITSVGSENTSTVAIRDFENSIVNNDFETGAVFSPSGEKVWGSEGDSMSVGLESFFEQVPYNDRSELTLTHNHPKRKFEGVEEASLGGTLSPPDIGVMLQNNLKGIRAVDEKYVYEAKRPEGQSTFLPDDTDPNDEFEVRARSMLRGLLIQQKADKLLNEIRTSMEPELMKRANALKAEDPDIDPGVFAKTLGKIDMDITIEAMHETMVKMAEEFGFVYTRTER